MYNPGFATAFDQFVRVFRHNVFSRGFLTNIAETVISNEECFIDSKM